MTKRSLALRAAANASRTAERQDRRRTRRWQAVALLIVASSLLVVACSANPPMLTVPPGPPPVVYDLSLAPEADVVLAGTVVELVATIVPDYDGELVWTTTAGSLVADGSRAQLSVPDRGDRLEVTVARAAEPDQRARAELAVRTGLTEPFTIAMLPDAQNMTQYADRAPQFVEAVDWIVDARDARNIVFVTQVGDVVSWAADEVEWGGALDALDRLDGVVPYSVALGDHEYFPEEYKDGSVANYLTHFGPQRYADYDWYLGSHDDGLSHLQTFTAGGRTFLHLAVEWAPLGTIDDPATPLGWARAVLEAHPGVPTIITTHAYLWDRPGDEGRFRRREAYVYADDGVTKEYVGPTGEELFEALVEPFPQVFMVFGGHFHLADVPDQGRVHQVSTDAAGLEVYEILANFQSWPNGGDGWMLTVEFLPDGGADGLDRIAVETYSPSRDLAGLDAYQTDADGTFHFDLDFQERFGLAH